LQNSYYNIEQLEKYGFGTSDVEQNEDAKLLNLHFTLTRIFDYIKANHISNFCFYIHRNCASPPFVLADLIKVFNICKFPIFEADMTYYQFIDSYNFEPSISEQDEFDVFAQTKFLRNKPCSLIQIRKKLKKMKLDFFATQYFNDYNAKLLLFT